MPLQTEVLTRWTDGSIRWLLLDFQTDLAAGQKKTFLLRHGPNTNRAAVDKPVRVTGEGRGVLMSTGPMRLMLSADQFRLLDAVCRCALSNIWS